MDFYRKIKTPTKRFKVKPKLNREKEGFSKSPNFAREDSMSVSDVTDMVGVRVLIDLEYQPKYEK